MIHCKIKLLVKIDTFCSVDVNDRSYQMDPVHLRNLLATRRIFLEEYSLADVTLIPLKEVALPPWVRAKYDWTGISIIYPSCCKRRLDRPDRHPGGGWVESWQSFHLRWRDGYPAHLQGNYSFPPEWNVLFIAPYGPVKVDLARTVSVPP